MTRKLELGPPKPNVTDLREQSARTILRMVRSQGHTYVELRENGKKFIYFCVLCLAPCYNDTSLFDHLKGNLHKTRLASARLTLIKPNPWPFNDGLILFDTSTENDKEVETTNDNRNRLLKICDNDDDLAIVKFVEEAQSDVQPCLTDDTLDDDMVIPRLVIADELSNVKVRKIGMGKIAARFVKKYDSLNVNEIKRMWCEWLGKQDNSQQDGVEVPEHDFAVVVFPYSYDLGRLDDYKSSILELENGRENGLKRKAPAGQPSSSKGARSKSKQCVPSTSTLEVLHTKLSSKAVRKEVRRQQRLIADKLCDICATKMIPGKDVAALLNLETGRIACCSRNPTGAFHVFHTSCVVHWILFCEYEIIKNRSAHQNDSQPKPVYVSNCGIPDKEIKQVLCPECQGTGVIIGGVLERPKFSLSQLFRSKLKRADAHRQWIESPEDLQNCSIGFHFPSKLEEIVEEKLEPIKLLRFYRAVDQSAWH